MIFFTHNDPEGRTQFLGTVTLRYFGSQFHSMFFTVNLLYEIFSKKETIEISKELFARLIFCCTASTFTLICFLFPFICKYLSWRSVIAESAKYICFQCKTSEMKVHAHTCKKVYALFEVILLLWLCLPISLLYR